MKAMGIVRQFDELGRIVIPKGIRKRFDLKAGDPVEIYVDDNGSIMMKKYEPACMFCQSVDDVVEFEGKLICKNCIAKLSNSIKNDTEEDENA